MPGTMTNQSSNTPTTPVKVPSAAASYTPATLDPDLRSQINMVLIRDGHVTKIQDRILHVLNADAANWPAAVQAHALQLLRSGDCTNFPALMGRVMDDIRHDTLAAAAASQKNGDGSGSGDNINGGTLPPSLSPSPAKTESTGGASNKNGKAAPPKLALPKGVIDEALRVTRESLEMVCEVEENGTS